MSIGSEVELPSSLSSEEVIRFAVPKKGRLYEQVVEMLNGIGLNFNRKPRLDIAFCQTFPCQLVFLPAKDIPTFVGAGDIDLGITGQDMVAEMGEQVDEIIPLGFGKCKLCVQAPVKDAIKSSSELVGKRICTSFPNLTTKFFNSLEAEKQQPLGATTVKFVSGSVEAACSLGVADAVVDLVETGTTMQAAGLEIIYPLMETQAVLIGNKNIQEKHRVLVDRIKKRIAGFQAANRFKMMHYNVHESRLPEAVKITPGRRAPDITPLGEKGFFSVGAMVEKDQASDIMDRLQDIGATDIFVLKLDNCRIEG